MKILIIGVRKCGTTSLENYLKKKYPDWIIERQEELFTNTKGPDIIAEKYYDYFLIVCIRNPVHRAFSDYQRLKSYYQKKDIDIMSFSDAIVKDPDNILEPGKYAKWCAFWDKTCPNPMYLWQLEMLQNYPDFPQDNVQQYDPMSQKDREYLEQYYRPYQKNLLDIIAKGQKQEFVI